MAIRSSKGYGTTVPHGLAQQAANVSHIFVGSREQVHSRALVPASLPSFTRGRRHHPACPDASFSSPSPKSITIYYFIIKLTLLPVSYSIPTSSLPVPGHDLHAQPPPWHISITRLPLEGRFKSAHQCLFLFLLSSIRSSTEQQLRRLFLVASATSRHQDTHGNQIFPALPTGGAPSLSRL